MSESIEQAVRRAERATNGSIAMMIEAGIKARPGNQVHMPRAVRAIDST